VSARRCETCRATYVLAPAPATECERCVKFRQVGAIVLAVTEFDFLKDYASRDEYDPTLMAEVYDALEAVATLCLIAPAQERRRHRKEIFEEQREAQRGARDAHADGYHEGRASHGDW
jgi:hypothetical protein